MRRATENSASVPSSKAGAIRLVWRIVRPLLVAYLVILLLIMILENWLVYPAPPLEWGNWSPREFQYEEVDFSSADGTPLHGWFFPNPGTRRAILYCHGNGEDVAAVGERADYLRSSLAASVFVFDYRGYGKSKGSPTEAGCIADGAAAQDWLANRLGLRPAEVVLMGRSLGSAVAIALAATNGARALILENAFSTMPDVAAVHYPWLPVRLLMKNRYDNLTRIRGYQGPVLQSHGKADVLIPSELAKVLFDSCRSKEKKWMEFEGLGHNDLPPRSYYRELGQFLDRMEGSDPPQ